VGLWEELPVRSVGIAYVLWLLLGFNGVHRFYCGRIGTGFLWLFTGGLCGIGWLVDLFLVPSLVREANAAHSDLNGHPQVVRTRAVAGAASANRVIYCTQCGRPMQVPADTSGQQYACPTCRTVLEVPA
jgi:hypothetical protein